MIQYCSYSTTALTFVGHSDLWIGGFNRLNRVLSALAFRLMSFGKPGSIMKKLMGVKMAKAIYMHMNVNTENVNTCCIPRATTIVLDHHSRTSIDIYIQY